MAGSTDTLRRLAPRALRTGLALALLSTSGAVRAIETAPPITERELARAGRKLEAGEPQATLKLLREARAKAKTRAEASTEEAEGDPSLEARTRTLEALALLRLGRISSAREQLEAVMKGAGATAGLRNLVAFEQARLLRRQGELEGAIELLETIPFGSWHWFEAREAEIDLLSSQGRIEAACALAAELAGELRGERREATAFLRLSRCLEREARFHARHKRHREAKRRLAEARGLYRAVSVLWPRNLSAATAREAAKRLSERELPAWGLEPADLLARGRTMMRKAHPRYSRTVLLGIRSELVGRASRPAITEADLMLGENAFRLRRFRSSWRWLANAKRHAKDPEQKGRAMLGIGRIQARGGRQLSLETYQEVARRFPGTEIGLHGLDLAAETARRMGKLELAREIFQSCLERAEAQEATDHLLLCRWRLAWLSHLDGKVEEALGWIGTEDKPIVQSPDRPIDPNLEGRIRYWRGRWQALIGQLATAQATLQLLAEDQPLRIYGLMARRRLGEQGVKLEAPRLEVRPDPPSAALHPAVAEAVEFDAMGLRQSSRLAIGSLVREGVDASSRRIAARLLEQRGDLPRSHRMAPLPWTGGLDTGPPIDREAARLAYPQAFSSIVEGEIRDERVDRELLWALMRNESGFDERARSTAGARGLTQMLLRTARRVALRHHRKPPARWQLYEPEVAVGLGSAYLGDLLARFRGHLGLALAAYNAGEAAVDRWRLRHAGQTFDVLLEEIPFEETRRYVGRVITFYAMYRLLNGDDLAGLPLDLTTPLLARR